MIRIGIIGCGKIADQHVVQIRRIPGAKIEAVCDNEPLMAEQMAERFKIGKYFKSAPEMLDTCKLDFVHITTPPQTHHAIGKLCLEGGCHIYVEKPFTINYDQAKDLVELAERRGLKLTVGYNVQFSQAAIKMRELIAEGVLGGDPIHIESYYCYSFKDAAYAKAVIGDKSHWVRTLPGNLLQNIIGHGIIKIAEFIKKEEPEVIALGFQSALIHKMNDDIIDELRIMIRDDNMTAFFIFSSQIDPPPHLFRIYGPKGSLIVNDHTMTVLKGTKKYKSYLNCFIPPIIDCLQCASNAMGNVHQFATKRLNFEDGRKFLIESFYKSAIQKTDLPIPYRNILVTARIMDETFRQLKLTSEVNILG